jgi:hypothetical protein
LAQAAPERCLHACVRGSSGYGQAWAGAGHLLPVSCHTMRLGSYVHLVLSHLTYRTASFMLCYVSLDIWSLTLVSRVFLVGMAAF